jgi:hypothetical protein
VKGIEFFMKYKAIKSDKNNHIQTPEKGIVEPIIITTPKSLTQSVDTSPSLLNVNTENVLQGIIWSEILGKPKSLRRGR